MNVVISPPTNFPGPLHKFIVTLLLPLFLCTCVSAGKYKRETRDYQARVEMLTDDVQRQQDSIMTLRFRLERSWGANDALLRTQDKMQDRLFAQEDELDDLRGNLNNTSARLSNELQDARAAIRAAEAKRDSLQEGQQVLVQSFGEGLSKAGQTMEKAIEATVPAEKFRVETRGDEVRLSVQEDVLFNSRSSNKLTDDAEPILRGVMDALQGNPLLKLVVVGHTDNQPNPRRGTDNWQYAALRATAVAEELADVYYLSPNRVVAASQGEFGPIASNSTSEGRAQNRRIDFVLTSSVSNLLRELGKL